MAEQDNRPLTDAEITEYLASQDDFSFELEVYRKCSALGLAPHHAWTYEDPVKEKPRHYDIRAYGINGNHRIYLAIECKGLVPMFPLLVSRAPRAQNESFHDVMLTTTGVSYSAFGYAGVRTVSGGRGLRQMDAGVGLVL